MDRKGKRPNLASLGTLPRLLLSRRDVGVRGPRYVFRQLDPGRSVGMNWTGENSRPGRHVAQSPTERDQESER
ncbi:hypothetical protein NHX12_007453, partial [Muraenolepis orangiensis]